MAEFAKAAHRFGRRVHGLLDVPEIEWGHAERGEGLAFSQYVGRLLEGRDGILGSDDGLVWLDAGTQPEREGYQGTAGTTRVSRLPADRHRFLTVRDSLFQAAQFGQRRARHGQRLRLLFAMSVSRKISSAR